MKNALIAILLCGVAVAACNANRKDEIEAEKATQELESPATGVLTEILVPEGQDAKVRTVLAIIETDA